MVCYFRGWWYYSFMNTTTKYPVQASAHYSRYSPSLGVLITSRELSGLSDEDVQRLRRSLPVDAYAGLRYLVVSFSDNYMLQQDILEQATWADFVGRCKRRGLTPALLEERLEMIERSKYDVDPSKLNTSTVAVVDSVVDSVVEQSGNQLEEKQPKVVFQSPVKDVVVRKNADKTAVYKSPYTIKGTVVTRKSGQKAMVFDFYPESKSVDLLFEDGTHQVIKLKNLQDKRYYSCLSVAEQE
jgi:hypothetical protein